MARRVSLVILHEDTLHQSFAAAFLSKVGLPQRIQPRFANAGNKAGIIRSFANEVASLLQQGAETHLLVMMDADGQSFAANETALLNTLDEEMRAKLQAVGRWHLVCPNYELENWCRNLEGRTFSEDRNLNLAYREDSECRPVARLLAERCQARTTPPNPLPSLEDACRRWNHYRNQHGL